MSTNIEDRLILLLREDGEPHGYWQALEERTGISAQRWRKAYARRQRPTPDMIEAMCKLKPQYAFWMATGITDAENGHSAPSTALTFPETPRQHIGLHWAERYFQHSIDLVEALYRLGNVDLLDDDERLKASERSRVGSQWWGSNLVDQAYVLAATDEYRELEEIRAQREKERHSATKPPKEPPKGVSVSAMPMVDTRTSHQGLRDLFWKPKKPA
jgi:hypothetical protein